MGYLESKKQAEIKITNLKDSFNFNIFRLGYISSDTKTGECLYENNQFMLFIKGCIQLKCFPKIDRTFNLTPVDFVAEFMSLNDFLYKGDGVFNLFNYSELIKIDELFQYLIKRGFLLECVSMEEWQNKLKKSGRNNALFRFLLYYRKRMLPIKF